MIFVKTWRSFAANAVLTSISACGTFRTPGCRIDKHRKHRKDRDDEQLGQIAEAEPQDDSGMIATSGVA